MNPTISDRELRLFQDLIKDQAGIHMHDGKRALISGRLFKRLRHYGLNNFREYYELVTRPDSPELQVVVDLLTTNETYFFRESAHFDFLRTRVAPRVRALREFRVWSAACSSGEEPYSIAMTLAAEGVERREIIGSDISRTILDRAVRGVYPIAAAEKIPVAYRREYCLKGSGANAGWFKVGAEPRRNLFFQQINLDRPLVGLGIFHMVWLRNAMIYFNDDTRRGIVDRVADVLEPRGYLFIGHSETLHRITNRLRLVQPAIYQKIA